MINDLLWKLLGGLGIKKEETFHVGKPPPPIATNTPVQQYQAPVQISAYQAQPVQSPVDQYTQPDFNSIESNLKSGYTKYGGKNLPALDYVPVMMDAIKNIQFWKDNPYLAAQLSILETSGGKFVTKPNNLINYGIRDPKINALFQNVGMEDALRRSMLEIGQTGNTYSKFRTGKPLTEAELIDFAETYEPQNGDYPRSLIEGLKQFQNN